ncbi:MAG: antibiotic biosynthesis monooxygenase [Fimbriimonas sp.]
MLPQDENDPPITSILEIRVRLGQEAEFERRMSELIQTGLQQDGHLGTSTIKPIHPGDPYRVVYKFDRRSNFERWHTSALRNELFSRVQEIVEEDHAEQHLGLETWFQFEGAKARPTPPKWKTTIVSWLAIYPVALAVGFVMQSLRFDAPLPVRVACLTGVVVPVAAYWAAPNMAKLMDRWLHPHR